MAAPLLLLLVSSDFSLCQQLSGHFDHSPPYQQPEPPQLEVDRSGALLAWLLAPSTAALVVVGSLGIVVILVILIISTETRERDNGDVGNREVVAIANAPAYKERNMKKIYVQPQSTDSR
uniref:Col_cuticle_N domain-containing protein n=1 Tax=Steinernema glaseri TaxID=37863 RepID=A0A1I7Z7T9_9BILA